MKWQFWNGGTLNIGDVAALKASKRFFAVVAERFGEGGTWEIIKLYDNGVEIESIHEPLRKAARQLTESEKSSKPIGYWAAPFTHLKEEEEE